jgi:hypothetical protein
MNWELDIEEVRYELPSSFYEKIKPQKEDKKRTKTTKKGSQKPPKKEEAENYEV